MSIQGLGAGDIGKVGGFGGPSAAERIDDLPQGGDHDGKSFGKFLNDALGGVNALQEKAGDMVQKFATGAPVDVHQVMIAMEQAGTALALTTQVRNKLVDAYQEIMRTQV